MAKYFFHAIFEPDEGSTAFTVTFPDLPGCITEGSDLEEAIYMAKDVLAGYLYGMEQDNETIPSPSLPNSLKLPLGASIKLSEVSTDYLR